MHLQRAVWLSFIAFAAHSVAYTHRSRTSGQYVSGTVYIDPETGAASFQQGVIDHDHGTAYGYFDNTLNTTGFAVLEIQTRLGNLTDNKQLMFAAGYLEAALTAGQIWLNFINFRANLIATGVSLPAFADFLAQQDTWMRSMIENHPGDEDAHWRHIAYIMAQHDGLYAGYKAMASPDWESDEFVVRMLNSFADHIELKKVLNPQQRTDYSKMSTQQIEEEVITHGHCSALVKVTPGFENIFMGHNTWFEYMAMNRIFKHYHLNVEDSATAAYSISFSGYPGLIHSMDEYYQMSSGLVMLQTTNSILNNDLFDLITHKSLLCWQRVRVACMMAHSGQEWYEAVRRYNSGTYNNQYMIVDLKKVRLGRGLDDGTLWVIEQIPGLVVGDDQTTILRAGYWPSYNIPFYPIIYNLTGFRREYLLSRRDGLSYQVSSRAKIFRRDQGNIVDMKSMQEFMRYNDYENDPYSGGNPGHAICCRYDVAPYQVAFGCLDAKVTDVGMARNMSTLMISGPTISHNLPPFTWDSSFGRVSHVGTPTEYNFDWVFTEPRM